MNHIVALSGGKDSTAMALRLAEIEPRDYIYLITPTGDELPEMQAHWRKLECLLGKPLTRVQERTLSELICLQKCLPSNRIRWCTRMLKIEPCLRFLREHQPAVLYVGLRADEEERKGLYSEEVETDFPLRRWCWAEADVWDYLWRRDVTIPWRTDCARCYAQRLSQWRRLWQQHPEIFADAERQERETGHTFRNPLRDTWPTSLEGLRVEFERGRIPRGADDQMNLWDDQEVGACRVCTL